MFLATEVMQRVLALGCLCICVTFLDELAGLDRSVRQHGQHRRPGGPGAADFQADPAAG